MGGHRLSDAKRRLLEKLLRGDGAAALPASARPRPRGPVPATAGQRAIWMHEQLAGRPVYNESATIRRLGPLDPGALARSLAEIVRRHESWRTRFSVSDGRLMQHVEPPSSPAVAVEDLRSLEPEEREERAAAAAASDAATPFDLARPPLFRARLVRFAENEHRLYLTLHHLIFDTASLFGIFFPELVALHDAFSEGKPSPLAEPGLQFADAADWEASRPLSAASVGFWRDRLASLPPPTTLPADRERRGEVAGRAAIRRIELPAALRDGVVALAAARGGTPFSVLFASFAALFGRYAGEDEVVVGCVSAARPRPEFEEVLGYFLNPVVVRASASGDPPFSEMVSRSREAVVSALAHSDVPYEAVAAAMPGRAGSPLFRILLSYEPPRAPVPPGWDLTLFEASSGNAKFDLSIELENRPEGFSGRFISDADLFDEESIALVAARWRRLLESAVADPGRRLSDLDLGEEAPSAAVSGGVVDPGMEPAPLALARRAAGDPRAEAIRFGRESTTYGDLAARVDAIARGLRARGVGRESLVAIALPRSAERVAAVLAASRAGAAWLPVGSDWPPARVAAVLEDARPALLIGGGAPPAGVPPATLSALAAEGERAGELEAPCPGDLAYVLYTSGSTGAPKGVMVEHRALSNFLAWSRRAYPLGPGDRVLQKAPLEFDASVWEIYAPLAAGAALVVAPPGIERDPRELVRLLREEAVTHVKLVPSLLRMLLAVPGFGSEPALRQVFCGGETLPPDLAAEFLARSNAELHNLYGPTETCVDVAAHRCVPADAGRRVPIGREIDNARLVVLDRRGRRLPAGIPGELCVGGLPLARGYLGREDLTRECFVPDPEGGPGDRLYRTGDRVRRRPDGELEFLGRLDEQRKVRGVRVEPGEIEAALRAQPEVADAVVVVRGGERAPSLAAYVASAPAVAAPEARRVLSRTLRERLASVLPSSFVPDTVTVLGALPLTASGKIDRAALPEPERFARGTASTPESPEERLLVRIWSEVLGVEAVGVHDNLFDLGGNSLFVFQISTRAAESGYAVTPRLVFEHPTVAELAAAAGTLSATRSGVTELTA